MRRPSSINEDLLRRQYSTFVDPDDDDNDASIQQQQQQQRPRVQSALESLSLLDPIDFRDDPPYVHSATNSYGAITGHSSDGNNDDEGESDLLDSITIKYENEDNYSITTTETAALLRKEIRAMIQLAVPVILTYVLELVPGIVTLVLVGRMDHTNNNGNNNNSATTNNDNTTAAAANDEHDDDINDGHHSSSTKLYVDAAALAVMFFNIIGLSTGQGMLTALDTLCASAHGANQSSKMGRYTLTAAFVTCCMFVPVSAILVNAGTILMALGQPIRVSRLAGSFVLYMLPGLPFLYVYELARKPCMANNTTLPMIYASIVGLLVTCSTGYYMVNYTSLGWVGAAMARSLGYMATVPTVCIGMYHTDALFVMRVYDGMIYTEAVTRARIVTFLHLGIPGMIQMMLEWCAFEILALECGILPNNDEAIIAIGANAVAQNIGAFLFMLYLGTSIAGNVRVGNALGAGDAHRAKMACRLSFFLGILLALWNTIFILTFRAKIPTLFTSDVDLISKARDLLLVVALFQLPDAINSVNQGIFRATGKQALAAKLNSIAYYIVGIPFGYMLGFKFHYGVEGLWFGLVAGLTWGSTVNTIILSRLDWAVLTTDTRKRLSIVHIPIK